MSDNWHEKVKNKNRDEIIAEGKELFLKYNLLNVNIKDVCTLAGIRRGTFYKYFDSIEELIFEIHVDILNNMTQCIKSVDKLDAGGIERLRLMPNAWVDFAKQNKDKMKFIILFDLYYQYYNTNDVLRLRRGKFLSKEINDHFLNSVINAGTKDKPLRGDLDVIKTGYYIFSTIVGVLQRMSSTALLYKNQDTVFEEVSQSVVESILNYIKSNDNPITLAELYKLQGGSEQVPTEDGWLMSNLWELTVDATRIKNEINFHPKYPSSYTARDMGAL